MGGVPPMVTVFSGIQKGRGCAALAWGWVKHLLRCVALKNQYSSP